MDATQVGCWRRGERKRLLALRTALPAAERGRWGGAIEGRLRTLLADAAASGSRILGIYWPFRAEFDPRPLAEWARGEGWRTALPAVVNKRGPLEYRLWTPGDPLVSGVWDIPVPERRAVVTPEAVLAPLVGFDEACYRLGYGGGYFDRTLAALTPRPRAIGVGFELQRLSTIHPHPFDVPMDDIVTEATAVTCGTG